MKDQDLILEEIEGLEALKPRIIPRTGFGDDNIAAVDAQIEVLQSRMDEEQIHDRWPNVGDESHVLGSALDALGWMEDSSEREHPESLVAEWEIIASPVRRRA